MPGVPRRFLTMSKGSEANSIPSFRTSFTPSHQHTPRRGRLNISTPLFKVLVLSPNEATRTCVVLCIKIIMYFTSNMVLRCEIAILCEVWSRTKGGREILSLLRNSDSPRHPRRDKKSKTRDEENRMVAVTNPLVTPFFVRCVNDS